MKIQVINPNTTAAMTAKIAAAARRAAAGRFEVFCSNPPAGPESIETACDTITAAPAILREVSQGMEQGCAGHVIACFDDPAVAACRELATGPVLGICEASMLAAAVTASRFSVVTTARAGIPIIEDMALRYGFERKCRSVRSCDMAVLDLDGSPMANAKVLAQVQAAVEDGAETVILGCAGMSDLADWLSTESGVPIIEGVAAAVGLVAGLASSGIATSKVGVFAFPPTSGEGAR